MKKIELTKGKYALVDDEDFERVNQYKWCVQGNYAGKWKGKRFGGKSIVYMHRYIMRIGDSDGKIVVDHINGNTLDNRKENLRIATRQENSRNKRHCNRFGYKGIVKEQNGRYHVMIWNGNKNLFVGAFSTKKQAAKAYDEKAKELFGEFARLNFP